MRIPWWAWVLAGCVVVAGLVAPFASSLPDGLESVIERANLHVSESGPASPLPDYETPAIGAGRASVFVAGAIGIVVVFAATYVVGRVLSRRSKAGISDPQPEPADAEAEREP